MLIYFTFFCLFSFFSEFFQFCFVSDTSNHVNTAGSVRAQLKWDNESINQSVTEYTLLGRATPAIMRKVGGGWLVKEVSRRWAKNKSLGLCIDMVINH